MELDSLWKDELPFADLLDLLEELIELARLEVLVLEVLLEGVLLGGAGDLVEGIPVARLVQKQDLLGREEAVLFDQLRIQGLPIIRVALIEGDEAPLGSGSLPLHRIDRLLASSDGLFRTQDLIVHALNVLVSGLAVLGVEHEVLFP